MALLILGQKSSSLSTFKENHIEEYSDMDEDLDSYGDLGDFVDDDDGAGYAEIPEVSKSRRPVGLSGINSTHNKRIRAASVESWDGM